MENNLQTNLLGRCVVIGESDGFGMDYHKFPIVAVFVQAGHLMISYEREGKIITYPASEVELGALPKKNRAAIEPQI